MNGLNTTTRKFLTALIIAGSLNLYFNGYLNGQPAQQPEFAVEGCKLLSPASYGFNFEPGFAKVPAEEQNISVRNRDGERVIAKLYCRVNDHVVALMPDGQLRDYAWRDVTLTEEKFKPLRKQDLARQLSRGQLANFKTDTTKNFVFIYNTSENFAKVTKGILESMRKGVIRQLKKDGFELEESSVPQVVIMFRSRQEFQAYRAMPAGVAAYYNMVTNQVVLYEPSARGSSLPLHVIQGQALSTITHEGAHQLLHNLGIQKRLSLWPMWLSEGLAEYYAPTEIGRRLRWKGAGVINDLRMYELEDYLQAQQLRGLDGSTVRNSIAAARLDSTGYATAWSIVHHLAENQPDKLIEYIKYISKLEPFQGMASHSERVPENLEHFEKFFGGDFLQVESDLIEHLKQQQYDSPFADAPHFVTVVSYEDGSETQRRGCIYNQERMALGWRDVFLNSLNASQRSTAQFETTRFSTRAKAAKYLTNFLD